ncbi:unnamed protein product [Paramecium sonneborni]|uniref:Uncharacterized protein n=1 Tax=Paramecium sonneborni TaxID=65129 RepID=A0A8S1RWT8_9CILI|nr:unnamed protein product [Paramecium sonneborni]
MARKLVDVQLNIERKARNNLSRSELYDEGGDGIKIGRQIELWEKFNDYSIVYFQGEYKNGRKVGRWDIYFKDYDLNFKKIGGGSYDEKGNGIKNGIWNEINDCFKNSNLILDNGEYKNGKRIGTWIQVDLKKIIKHSELKKDN